MSFSVADEEGTFEWSSGSVNGVFACRSHVVDPAFHRMLRDLLRFQREARGLIGLNGSGPSLGDWLDESGYLARLRRAADRSPGVRGLVGGPSADAVLPGELPRRVLRQPRPARPARAAQVARRDRRQRALRRAADGAVRGPDTHVDAGRMGRTPCRRRRAEGPRARAAAVRPRGARAALRPGAAHPARPQRAGVRDPLGDSATSPTTWCCTPTARCFRDAGARGRAGTSICSKTRRRARR